MEETHHGRLSSASTGRLAALRLPFAVLSEENVISFGGAGTSMSISSSKSDILATIIVFKGRQTTEVELRKMIALEKIWCCDQENGCDASC